MSKLLKWMEALPAKTDGTYVVITRDQCWGRGGTLEEAVGNARKAGSRSMTADNTIVVWQPNSAWQEARTVHNNAEAAEPFVGQDGSVRYWGGKLEMLHKPNKP